MDSGIECVFSKFEHYIKMNSTVNNSEETQQVWEYHENLMKFSNAKCKVLHLCGDNLKYQNRLDDEWIENCNMEKDMGCW